MNSCSSPDQFRRFLADQLSAAEHEALDAHLKWCVPCQQTLEGLLDESQGDPASDWPILAAEHAAVDAEPLEPFLRELLDNRPTSIVSAPGSVSGSESPAIRFPDSPTARGPLGRLEFYHIMEELGHGSYGVVFKAYDEKLDCLVALKVLKPEFAASASDRARFESEARKAARVRHDHVVIIHRVGSTPAFVLPYFVMEYLDGGSLSDRLKQEGRLEPREAARVVRQAALGLAAAHEHKLVHRDVKSSNLMLEKSSGRVKITDFGLARAVEVLAGRGTQSGGIVGTPAYMSPEQITSPGQIDGRSDVYSVGVVLYELLTGELPFRGLPHLIYPQVVRDEPLPPRKLNDAVPRNLETITLTCLAKEPGNRYKSAGELAADIQRWLNGEPIWARPAGVAERTWRWCRRKPAWATAGGLAAALVLSLVVGSFFVALLMHHSKTSIETAFRQAQTVRAEGHLNRGLDLCEQGDGGRGLLEFVRGLQVAPEEAEGLHGLLRTNLGAWAERLNPLKNCVSHPGLVLAAAFSPDGLVFVTGSSDHNARLWDARTGEPAGPTFPHESPVHAVAFGPNGLLLTGCSDGTVRLWDRTTGKDRGLVLRHDGPVVALAFSPGGETILTGSHDKTARLWETATGREFRRLPHGSVVTSVAYCRDGKTVLTEAAGALGSQETQLWDARTGQRVGPCLQHQSGSEAAAFSPDGKTVLTGDPGAKARQLWETATDKRLVFFPQDQGRISSLAYSPDGQVYLAGNWDKSARLWDAATGKAVGQPLVHAGPVRAVAFSPDGRTLLTGGDDQTVRLWEVKTPAILLPHGGPVRALALTATGETVLTGSLDGKARLWDSTTGQLIGQPFVHGKMISCVALSPDGRRAVTGTYGGPNMTAQIWDVASGAPVGPPIPHDHWVWSVSFSPDGQKVVTADGKNSAWLWDAATGRPAGGPFRHASGVYSAVFSPDGEKILTASADGTARIWNAATGAPIGRPLPHGDVVHCAVFSPDGSIIVTASNDYTARLWDATSGEPFATPPLEHQAIIWVAAFSPDGKSVVTGSTDHTARVWEVATGKPQGPPLWHRNGVFAVAFSPDGKAVLTGSNDHTARLWDAASGRPLGPPLPHQAQVQAVAFTKDGFRVVTGSDDGFARIWQRPAPARGEVGHTARWVEVLTGMELDTEGGVRVLDAATWHERRRELDQPGTAAGPGG